MSNAIFVSSKHPNRCGGLGGEYPSIPHLAQAIVSSGKKNVPRRIREGKTVSMVLVSVHLYEIEEARKKEKKK